MAPLITTTAYTTKYSDILLNYSMHSRVWHTTHFSSVHG